MTCMCGDTECPSCGLAQGTLDERDARITELEAERDALRAALAPFAHDDLCKELGGNVEGDASIIFMRNRAQITLGDCRRARALFHKTTS